MNNNFNQNKHSEVLNEYLSNIKVLNNNLYNLHFNVVGSDFLTVHKLLDDYYQKTADMYDEIAERIKTFGGFPITSLTQYENISTIKSMVSQPYEVNQVYNILINDFSFMIELSKEVEKVMDNIGDKVTSGIIGNYIYFFEKQLWMIKASTK